MNVKELSMKIVHPQAAGIDIGSKSHWVAVDQVADHVKEFGVYTQDHQKMIDYLRSYNIDTIAMESTGSYWQTLFNALQRAGFEVILVQGSHTKNVKGKKTDMLDCMWIQKLHSLGLLSASFLLSDYLQAMRTYYAHREHLIEQTSKYVNKMQKALRLMNIRLDVVINDITGQSGRAILDAIVAGHRDPEYLASLTSQRLKNSKETIIASLQGQWRDELLFELKSCLAFYDAFKNEIDSCDQKINDLLDQYTPPEALLEPVNPNPSKKKLKRVNKFSPVFNVRQYAFSHFRTDLYEIPGVSHSTVLCFLCNMGADIKRFASAKQFASWMRLVPNNKVSGGRVITSRTPKGKNAIALALRKAANSIGNLKDHPLTPFFKRIAYRKGRNAAITATARKLAIIIWNMIIKQQPYRPVDHTVINERRKSAQVRSIKSRLFKLNLTDEEMKSLFQRTSLSAT
jgi:transposase